MYNVYILQSKSTDRYYVGSTHDVSNRFEEHNMGECRSTRFGMPWIVVQVEDFATRSEAVTQEKKIKSRGIGRYLEDIVVSPA